MDVRTALIAGTAFAGVLIAGAVAAPRSGSSDSNSSGNPVETVATSVGGQSPTDTLVSLPSSRSEGVRDGGHKSHENDEHDDHDDHEEDDD